VERRVDVDLEPLLALRDDEVLGREVRAADEEQGK
jgi:hypothetical protein